MKPIFPFEATRSSDIGRNPELFGLKVIENGNARSGQAQFNANHLPVIDPAMSEEDLCYVISRYKDFAARVSRKELVGQSRSQTTDIGEATTFRFDERFIEVLLPGEKYKELGPLLFNWMSAVSVISHHFGNESLDGYEKRKPSPVWNCRTFWKH